MRTVIALALFVLAGPASAHEWYSGYRTIEPWGASGKTVSCCNSVDCREYSEVEEVSGGIWFKQLDYVSPWSRIRPSPDGKWHACKMPSDSVPRCLFGPTPGF